jgi:hypothetical protein
MIVAAIAVAEDVLELQEKPFHALKVHISPMNVFRMINGLKRR